MKLLGIFGKRYTKFGFGHQEAIERIFVGRKDETSPISGE
jgi:hypothetical protein